MTSPGPPPVEVAGFRGEAPDPDDLVAALDDLRGRHPPHPPDLDLDRAAIQAVDARAVAGPDHLRLAARRAVTRRRRGTAVARDLAVEVLLYAAGTRQIQEALDRMGVAPGQGAVAVVALLPPDEAEETFAALADELDLDRDDAVLEADEAALDAHDVPEAARQAVPDERRPDLVLERVALRDADA